MTSILRIDTSIQGAASTSRSLADIVERTARNELPELGVTHRDLALDPVPADVWGPSFAAGMQQESDWTAEQRAARGAAEALADEFAAADGYLFATSLYNWNVSQHLKTWVDVMMTDPRFGPRAMTAAGRPAVLVIARGGDYSAEGGRAHWDHATGWLRQVLGEIWGLDVRLVEVDLTLAPFRPYLEAQRPAAAAKREQAERAARTEGERLTRDLLLRAETAGTPV